MIHARFVGGPADGLTLDVRAEETYVAALPEGLVEFPDHPDEELLNRTAGLWARYRANTSELGGEVPYVWASARRRAGA